MESDVLRYDKWIEEALRSVIRRALSFTASNGLAGEHHFYITFRTDADEVEIPAYLRAQHPEEMTIVLQHQFEDLEVDRDGFWVTLHFGGKPERLYVPLNSVSAFADPSVNFGLQLKTMEVSAEGEELADEELFPAQGESLLADANDDLEPPLDPIPASDNDAARKSGEVITLDAFRKK